MKLATVMNIMLCISGAEAADAGPSVRPMAPVKRFYWDVREAVEDSRPLLVAALLAACRPAQTIIKCRAQETADALGLALRAETLPESFYLPTPSWAESTYHI